MLGRLDGYRLKRRLGRGGFAEVWLAEHLASGRLVALKGVVDAAHGERLRREAELLRRLSHPHIISCIEFSAQPCYYTMEYADGGDLGGYLGSPLGVEEVEGYFLPLLEAVEYAHGVGVLHLDIKPSNILLCGGVVKLSDFGLPYVEAVDRLEVSAQLDSGLEPALSFAYMAPELRSSSPRLSVQADIYSLGVVLFQILTGQLPAGISLPSEVYPSLGRGWDMVLKRALSFSPSERYGSVSDFRAEVRRNLGGGTFWVRVPAGVFLRGGERVNESPQREVYLEEFWISRYPVTNREYFQFILDRDYPPPPHLKRRRGSRHVYFEPYLPLGMEDLPVVNITYRDALEFARWFGARLPTEAEWEKAARGCEGRRYPWGEEMEVSRVCHCSGGYTGPVSVYELPQGASPYGCMHMSGNVWEWCRDWYGARYYRWAPVENPLGPEEGECRVIRGGSYSSSLESLECSYRGYVKEGVFYPYIGFRLVRVL